MKISRIGAVCSDADKRGCLKAEGFVDDEGDKVVDKMGAEYVGNCPQFCKKLWNTLR